MSLRLLTLLGAAGLLLVPAANAGACPFCPAPTLTLTEQASDSDVVLLAEWTAATKSAPGESRTPAATTFVVKQTMKGPFKVGQTIRLAGYQPAKPGELFLLTGLGSGIVEWDLPVEFSQAAYDYMAAAPSPKNADGAKVPAKERLPYFVSYLEYPSDTVANDAYGEFANAPYEDIAAVKAQLPREKLRTWVTSPDTAPSRLGLYGLLLGLCGNDADAAAVQALLVRPSDEFRIGLDGVMSGYLLLKGTPGLELIRKLKLENKYLVDAGGEPLIDESGGKQPVPFSEVYAAMQAVRFMWSFGDERIPPADLKAAMRTLIDRPELIDFAVTDLARWKDWSVMDRLAKLYGEEAYQTPGIKQSIIRYLLAAVKDQPATGAAPEHVVKAEQYLAEIEKADPDAVKRVKQFLILVE